MCSNEIWTRCAALLEEEGTRIDESTFDRLNQYAGLIREWNKVVSLVSRGDLDHLWSRHIADALSLSRYVREATAEGIWLDVGSGGGFPVIPVKILLPEVSVCMIDRSERKIGFLRKALAALGLRDIDVTVGAYPERSIEAPALLTSRAVEKPGSLTKAFEETLCEGAVFLCQSGKPVDTLGKKFHVEHIQDAWTEAGLRRGDLYRIQKSETA